MYSTGDAQSFQQRCQRDPVWFCREVLGIDPWQRQKDIIESVRDNKRTAVRSAHGVGKSFSAGQMVLPWWLYSYPDAIVATTAPTFRQVEKILWQEVAKMHARARVPLGGRLLQTELKLAPGWYAFGFSTNDPNAFQGLHSEHVLVVFDEAPGIDRDIWTAAEGVLTSSHCRFLAMGNPTEPAGPMYEEFTQPGTSKMVISAFDTPNFTTFGITLEDIVEDKWKEKITGDLPAPWLVTPDWVADKVRRWGVNSPIFKSRVLGDFPDAGDDTLIPLSWIEAAQRREYEPRKDDPIELAVDIARFGNDETVLGKKHGYRYRTHWTTRKQDLMATAGRIKVELVATGARYVKIDEIGVGGGPVDRLKEQKDVRRKIIGMNAGGEPIDKDRFLNARGEWFWTLREMFDPSMSPKIDIDPKDDELAAQLSSMKYKIHSNGRIYMESKADMKKKRGLPSPDRADTMSMAYAAPGSGQTALAVMAS